MNRLGNGEENGEENGERSIDTIIGLITGKLLNSMRFFLSRAFVCLETRANVVDGDNVYRTSHT